VQQKIATKNKKQEAALPQGAGIHCDEREAS
jgi:hypothetical protein